MIHSFLTTFTVSTLLLQFTTAANTCQKLAVCAIDKCIPGSTVFPPTDKVLPNLLSKVNFGCIFGPACYDSCVNCETCHYAQEQMKFLILRESTQGKCPKLEACAQSCLDDGVADPFSCVFRQRCINHCLDNRDCPQCYDIVKRVFTGYCYRSGFIEHYNRRCKKFFDDLASQLVSNFSKKTQ